MHIQVPDVPITTIEWAHLPGRRPRIAGCNARLGSHGIEVAPPIARVRAGDHSGFGWSRISPDRARAVIGKSIRDIFDPETGVSAGYRDIEFPVWDLVARANHVPVYAMVNPDVYGDLPFRVPCYDSSLYMNDIDIADDRRAADLIAEQAAAGMQLGHRNFKIKVGRGAMHMGLAQGTARDIMVIRAVRRVAGNEARIMIDANNGYNYNIAVQVLSETAAEDIYWIEEPFHEDRVLLEHLGNWLDSRGLQTKIADGEGECSGRLLEWARDGIVDVVQYDIHHPGFTHWCKLGPELDRDGIGSAPHNWGDPFGNYAACHLAAGIEGFEMVEWDEARVEGLDFSGYTIEDGVVTVPDSPGFGIALEGERYSKAVAEGGFAVG